MAVLRKQIRQADKLLGAYRLLSAPGWLCFFGLLAGNVTPGYAEDPLPSEYQVKAAFLINFPKYVDWPTEAFTDAASPIVLAVLGESKVTDEIEKIMAGRIINGRAIVLKRLTSIEDLPVCHILFVSTSGERQSPNVLEKFKGVSVLTVGESDGFLDNGGVINLARRDRKISLEVNLSAAGAVRLKISSKLLSVASVVKGRAK